MSDNLKVFVGWDSREPMAFDVAKHSLLRHASIPVEVVPIKLQALVEHGLYTRAVDCCFATATFCFSTTRPNF